MVNHLAASIAGAELTIKALLYITVITLLIITVLKIEEAWRRYRAPLRDYLKAKRQVRAGKEMLE